MSLDDFNAQLKNKNLIGYWSIPNTSTEYREPEPKFEPHLWKWAELDDALHRAHHGRRTRAARARSP